MERAMRFDERITRCLLAVVLMLPLCGLAAWAQTQTTPSTSTQAAPAPPPPAPAMDVPLNVKAAQPPSTDDLAKGDPGGTKTGTVSDVVPADATKGLTLADTVNQVGQNRIAINFVWTLSPAFWSCSCRPALPS